MAGSVTAGDAPNLSGLQVFSTLQALVTGVTISYGTALDLLVDLTQVIGFGNLQYRTGKGVAPVGSYPFRNLTVLLVVRLPSGQG